jgi:hypothetical protein
MLVEVAAGHLSVMYFLRTHWWSVGISSSDSLLLSLVHDNISSRSGFNMGSVSESSNILSSLSNPDGKSSWRISSNSLSRK